MALNKLSKLGSEIDSLEVAGFDINISRNSRLYSEIRQMGRAAPRAKAF